MTEPLRDLLTERANRTVAAPIEDVVDDVRRRVEARAARRRNRRAVAGGVATVAAVAVGMSVIAARGGNDDRSVGPDRPAAAATSSASLSNSATRVQPASPRLEAGRPAPATARFSLGVLPLDSRVQFSSGRDTAWVTGDGAKLGVAYVPGTEDGPFPLTLAGYPARFDAATPKSSAGVTYRIGARYARLGGSTNLQLTRDELLEVADSLTVRQTTTPLPVTVSTVPQRRPGSGTGEPAGDPVGLVAAPSAPADAPVSLGLLPSADYSYARSERAVTVYDGPGAPSAAGGTHFVAVSVEKYVGAEATYPDTADGFPATLRADADGWHAALKYNDDVVIGVEVAGTDLSRDQVLALLASLDIRTVADATTG